jgi:hypothetical protein
MDYNIIRSIIFFVAGVLLILFPKRIHKFQVYLINKLHIKYDAKTDGKHNTYSGIILIAISIILLGIALN